MIFRPVYPREHLSRPDRPYLLPPLQTVKSIASQSSDIPKCAHALQDHQSLRKIVDQIHFVGAVCLGDRSEVDEHRVGKIGGWVRVQEGLPAVPVFLRDVCHVEDADSLAAALYLRKLVSEPWKRLDGCEYATYDGALFLCALSLDKACVLKTSAFDVLQEDAI